LATPPRSLSPGIATEEHRSPHHGRARPRQRHSPPAGARGEPDAWRHARPVRRSGPGNQVARKGDAAPRPDPYKADQRAAGGRPRPADLIPLRSQGRDVALSACLAAPTALRPGPMPISCRDQVGCLVEGTRRMRQPLSCIGEISAPVHRRRPRDDTGEWADGGSRAKVRRDERDVGLQAQQSDPQQTGDH
jgi:hypothetical protein